MSARGDDKSKLKGSLSKKGTDGAASEPTSSGVPPKGAPGPPASSEGDPTSIGPSPKEPRWTPDSRFGMLPGPADTAFDTPVVKPADHTSVMAPIVVPETTPTPGKRRHGWVRVAMLVVGVVGIAGIGFLVYRGLTGDSSGAGSPEDAVNQLVEALNNEDPIAAAAVIDPDEAHTLAELLATVEDRLAQAKIDKEPGGLSGLDIEVEDITFRTRELSADLAEVEIVRGRAKWKIQPNEMAERMQAAGLKSDSGTISRGDLVMSGSHDRGSYDIDPHLIAVKRDGGWYISLAYTAASYLAESQGLPRGDFKGQVPDDLRVADSPERAIIDLLESAGDLDPEESLRSLPVEEWGVLWAYRDAIDEYVEREQPDDFSVAVDDHRFEIKDLGGGYKKVIVSEAEGRYKHTDEYGESRRTDWELDGWCMRTEDDTTCVGDEGGFLLEPQTYGIDQPFFVVREERGGWVVSPNATFIEYGKQIAESMTNEMIYRWLGAEKVAPADGVLTLGKTTSATLNSAGYALYEVELTKGQQVFLADSADDGSYIELFDPDGAELWDVWRGLTVDITGTYRVGVFGEKPGLEVPLTIHEIPVKSLEGSTASDSLTSDQLIVDFAFRVPETGSWVIEGDQDGVSARILDEDRFTDLSWCESSSGGCDLRAGTTYYLRVRRYDGSLDVAFSFDIVPGVAASIDGADSVSDYVRSGVTNVHEIEVGDGLVAHVQLEGDYDAGDLDLVCRNLGCGMSQGSGPYEEVTVYGPVSGTIEVYGYRGASGGYSMSITAE